MLLRVLLLTIFFLSNYAVTSVSACSIDDCYRTETKVNPSIEGSLFTDITHEVPSKDCSDSDCCRKNPLQQPELITSQISISSTFSSIIFQDPANRFENNVLEVIKPPLT